MIQGCVLFQIKKKRHKATLMLTTTTNKQTYLICTGYLQWMNKWHDDDDGQDIRHTESNVSYDPLESVHVNLKIVSSKNYHLRV